MNTRLRIECGLVALVMTFGVFLAMPAVSVGPQVLVFSKTAGYRHASIPAAAAAIQQLGLDNGFTVDVSESSAIFNDADLTAYKAVVFMLTTGDVLNLDEQAVFERYIAAGGGYVGIHSASDTESGWGFYSGLVGASFNNHPASRQLATVKVADRVHPSTASLPERWTVTDEWYNFKANPRGLVHVLATLDESTYSGGQMGFDHPISWCQGYKGGRSWYTGMGHDSSTYSDPQFLTHLLGGIQFATAGDTSRDCGGTTWSKFDKVILESSITQPMSMSIANDGRVFFLERTGALRIYLPDRSRSITAANLNVNSTNEYGLQGIALDPAFQVNSWIYLFYTSATPLEDRLSRFTLNGESLDLASEKIMLRFPVSGACCHEGGSLAFGPDGNLYLSTGDATLSYASGGYTPIDERSGQSLNDAQRTSGNRNSIQGKILRITPQPDATYTVPTGNLFAPDGSNGRPEIYIMGVRNPFRLTVDVKNNWLYWGDVGPDGPSDSAARGPRAHDEINRAKSAGNFGWPYCIANNLPYRDYDFATGVSGDHFNCAAPINTSPNNTGSQSLPPAQGSLMSYTHQYSPAYPEFTTGGMTAEMGPVYRWDQAITSDRKLPRYYDDSLFIYDWSRAWINEVKLDSSGAVLKINRFFPGVVKHPIEMEQGPDGALYVLDWGNNADYSSVGAALFRIEYSSTHTPVARLDQTNPTSGSAPLTVNFSSTGSLDPDREDSISFKWDFQDDGIPDATDANPTHSYPRGNYTARLTVTDSTGKSSSATTTISSGNFAPTLQIETPPNGQVHRFGESFAYVVSASDFEDGSIADGGIPCSSVKLTVALGHDGHSHEVRTYDGCQGSFETAAADHGGGSNIYSLITASYTDRGASGVAPMTGTTSSILQPDRKEAEFFDFSWGVGSKDFLGSGTRKVVVTQINPGDWIGFKAFNLDRIEAMGFSVATWWFGGRIEVRLDSPSGPKIGEAIVSTTSSSNEFEFREVFAAIENPGGTHNLYLVFKQLLPNKIGVDYVDGSPVLFSLDWMEFLAVKRNGVGIASTIG